MTPVYDVEEFLPVEPGLYEAELTKIMEKTSFFTNENEEEERRRYWQWLFGIKNDDEYEGRTLSANVGDAFGPRSKQRQWVEAMLGRELKAGEKFNTDDLIGGVYHITVHHKKKGDKTYAEITSVNKIRRCKGTKKAAAPAPEPELSAGDEAEMNAALG